MAGYYAALLSLMNIMEDIKIHPRISTSLDKKLIKSLGEHIGFFVDFIESHNSLRGREEVEDLESQIAAAAHAAECVIKFHIGDHVLRGSTEESCSCLLDLQKIMEDMDSIKDKVIKVNEERGFKDLQPTDTMPPASSRPPTTGKTTMVGFDDYLVQLLEWLTREQSYLQIIPITGMGGIGKTTLATNVYEIPLVVQHFDVRAWVTISQEYNVKGILLEILLDILSGLGRSIRGKKEKTEDELGEQLYKSLVGRRYLIILDDIWSVEAWDKIKFFFPANNNGSRIIMTTRLLDVAKHSGSLVLALDLLDGDKSWDLFCEKVFGQEDCPRELEEIGKEIVGKCKGLPLLIAATGGLLKKSSKTQENWKKVAKDLSSILNTVEDNGGINILSLSYNHLSTCLKPCFLYMGIFPEDCDIRVSKLIKLWVAEGLVKPNKDQSLEEIANSYINDLVERNLVTVRRWRLGCRLGTRTCNIHDLVRELCIRIAEKEKFFCVTSVHHTGELIRRNRCIVIDGSNGSGVVYTMKSASLVRSVEWRDPTDIFNPSRDTNLLPIHLRFLAYQLLELPSSISLLWNLQTLIIYEGWSITISAPSKIWKMLQLRHLKFRRIILPNPAPSSGEQDDLVLGNLQTLKQVVNLRWSEEVCKRMPNIKKLAVVYEGFSTITNFCLYNISRLTKLESLEYTFYRVSDRDGLLQNLSLPTSLKKLTLCGCRLHWEDLTTIGMLPHLEVLKLHMAAVEGKEWNPVEGEFLRLKFLEINDWGGDLIYWNADSFHFPVLENLILAHLLELDGIPLGMGEISTLGGIRVEGCSISAAISAIQILEEQESLGNQDFHVEVVYLDKEKRETFWEAVEQNGLTTRNFQFGRY